MNDFERWKEERLPPEYRPLWAWAYFGYQLIFLIPIVGLMCLIVFSLSSENINRRNFARSYFCIYLIVAIIIIIAVVAVGSTAFSGGGYVRR